MKKILVLPLFLLLAIAYSGCDFGQARDGEFAEGLQIRFDKPQLSRDFAEIKEEGVLRAITIYNSTSYFLYRGEPLGFEYELVEELARDLDVRLEVIVAKNVNELFDLLNEGKGDIITWGLTITEPRQKIIDFTDYHYVTHQVLVQSKPDGWRKMPGYKLRKYLKTDVIDLIGDTVFVPFRSAYYHRLKNLEQEIGGKIFIDTAVGAATTEDLIQKVANGEIRYTVADHNLASLHRTYYSDLDISTPVSLSQRVAWAVRNNSPELLNEVNAWIKNIRKRDIYYVLYNKYFRNKKFYTRRIKSEFYSKETGQISRYDSLIKTYADTLDWDWRLLASIVYQESRFKPNDSSWAGAVGLMQLMPLTAQDLGVSNPYDPKQNLEGGTKYLRQLYDRFDEVKDTTQRIKFALASYNCGLGHVLDARRLADKNDKDPNWWDDNVEIYLRKMSSLKYYGDPVVKYGFVRGEEPYNYVRDIFLRYEHYRSLLPIYKKTMEVDAI